MVITWIKKLFEIRMVRYLVLSAAIILVVSNIKNKEINRLNDNNEYLIEAIADQLDVPKYSIENRIDGIRKKANVALIPDNEITHIGDNEIEPEPKKKRKGLFGWLKKKH